MKMLRKLSAVLLFAALTLAVLAAANFLLVDDVHSYSRAMLQELYADAGKIDTLFFGVVPLLPQCRPQCRGRRAGDLQL